MKNEDGKKIKLNFIILLYILNLKKIKKHFSSYN